MCKAVARVDFAVIGVQKSGTRALGHFLAQHPDVGLSKVAEPHYFDLKIHEDESSDYAGYHSLFPAEALQKVTGDITPIYIFKDGCLEALRRYNPDMRIIVVLRDPVERAYSQWAMEFQRGTEHRRFGRAIIHEMLHRLRYGQHPVYSYIQRGFYGRQIERLFLLFPPEQCLVLLNEDLRHNHLETMARVFEFLKVSNVARPEARIVHSREYASMNGMIRWGLRWLYRRDVRKAEALTGLKCRAVWQERGTPKS